jgi:hypothetical protein
MSTQLIVVDESRAGEVLAKIDQLLLWKSSAEAKVDRAMMKLANCLFEAKQNAYYVQRGYKDESDWINKIFPQSRTFYYVLIGIAKHLGHLPYPLLEDLGFHKCAALVRIKKHFGTVPENYILHAQNEDKETFIRRVRAELSDSCDGHEPKEEIQFQTFKFYGDGIFEVNEAIRSMQTIVGSDKSVSDCLRLICVDFLSGSTEDGRGVVQGRNGYIRMMIGRLLDQLDRSEVGIYDKGISQYATWVERGKVNGDDVQIETR